MPLLEITESKPLVSIIITSYNRAYCITRAIESALAQDYSNIEVLISDNNSTDNTDNVVRKYLTDPRVRYSKNPVNIGMIPNFKRATNELANGEYVVYVSSDDYLEDKGFISDAMAIVTASSKVRMIFGKMITYNLHSDQRQAHPYGRFLSKQVWNGFDVFKQFPENGYLCFGGNIMRRSDIIDLKVFDSDSLNADAECILKIMILGDVGFVDKDAYVFVRHGENESGDMTAGSHFSKLRYIENVHVFAAERLDADHLPELEKWRKAMLDINIKTSLYFLRMHNPPEFVQYKKLISANYPEGMKEPRKVLSMYLKIKLIRRFFRFVYRVFKPAYYRQEFIEREKGSLKGKLT